MEICRLTDLPIDGDDRVAGVTERDGTIIVVTVLGRVYRITFEDYDR